LKSESSAQSLVDGQALKTDIASEKFVREVKGAYDSYLARSGKIPERPVDRRSRAMCSLRSRACAQKSQHLFDLGQSLANTHYKSRNQCSPTRDSGCKGLRLSVLGLLGLLFVFGLALARGLPRHDRASARAAC